MDLGPYMPGVPNVRFQTSRMLKTSMQEVPNTWLGMSKICFKAPMNHCIGGNCKDQITANANSKFKRYNFNYAFPIQTQSLARPIAFYLSLRIKSVSRSAELFSAFAVFDLGCKRQISYIRLPKHKQIQQRNI